MTFINRALPIQQTSNAPLSQTSQQQKKSNDSLLIEEYSDPMNRSKERLANPTEKLALQLSPKGLRSQAKKPNQTDATKSDDLLPKFKVWPHIPDDIGIVVFPKADVQLNPMALWTLMNIRGEDNIPHFLTHAAWDDRLWKPFSSTSLTSSDTSYAQAFADREDAMPAEHWKILEQAWCAPSSAAKLGEHDSNVQNNFDIVMAAVTHEGRALEYASDVLKHNPDIVMAAVRQDGVALAYASAALQDERDIVMTAVSQNGLALKYASAVLQDERDIVMTAISQCGWALHHASVALKADRDIVSTAVRRNGLAILFADASLRNDPTLDLIHVFV